MANTSTGLVAIAPATGPAAPFVALLGSIAGIFGAHHAAAVKNEAAGMNQIIPMVRQSFNEIVSQVNAGTITVQQANSYLDAIWQQYEDVAYKQFKIKRKDCNGPCVFEKQMRQDAENIKNLLNSGRAGSVTVSAINPGRGYQNFPAYILTYNGPAGIAQSIENMLGLSSITGNATLPPGNVAIGNIAVPVWMLIAAGGIVLLFAVTNGK